MTISKRDKKHLQRLRACLNEYRRSDDFKALSEAVTNFTELRFEVFNSPRIARVEVVGWVHPSWRSQLIKSARESFGPEFSKITWSKRTDLKSLFPKGWRRVGFHLVFSAPKDSNAENWRFTETRFVNAISKWLAEGGFSDQVNGHLDNSLITDLSPLENELVSDMDNLIDVVEATCDRSCATILLRLDPEFISEYQRERLRLIAGIEEYSPSNPWHILSVSTPHWTYLENSTRNFEQARFSKIEPEIWATSVTTSIAAPLRKFASVTDAQVFHGGTVTSGNRLLDNDPAQFPALNFVAGRWDHVVGSPTSLDKASVKIPEESKNKVSSGILLSGRADSNWFHWMMEYLPRLVQIENSIDPSVPVIASSSLGAAARASLAAVTSRRVIFIDRSRSTFVGELFLLGPSIYHPDTTILPWTSGTSMDFDSIDAVRDRILRSVPDDRAKRRRVYWWRASTHRNLTNQEDVAALAKSFGFEIFDPDVLSLAEQVNIFRSADVLMSPMGALTPNFTFMKPNTSIISLTSRPTEGYVLPAIIGTRYAGKFTNVIGESQDSGSERSKLDYFHNPFTIEINVLKRVLDRLQ